MALTRRTGMLVASVLLAVAALGWLHDPAWLGTYRHGFHGDGWTGGRASFFVPADQASVTFEVAGHDQFTMQVSIYVDGHLVDRFSADEDWRAVTVSTGQLAATTRRHRRVDIHVARTWGPDRKGVRVRRLTH